MAPLDIPRADIAPDLFPPDIEFVTINIMSAPGIIIIRKALTQKTDKTVGSTIIQ